MALKEYVTPAPPTPTPVTSPVVDEIVATLEGVIDHVPPGVALARVIVAPIQTWSSPVIGIGAKITSIVVEAPSTGPVVHAPGVVAKEEVSFTYRPAAPEYEPGGVNINTPAGIETV